MGHKQIPKAQYKSWIWTYERRKEKMDKHVRELAKKLRIWKKQVKIMEEREAKTIALGNAIALFTGWNVKNSIENREKEIILARKIFFKYGLEHGISGKDLSIYTGVNWETSKDVASNNRTKFTRSFEFCRENRELYNRFCLYIERISQESIENSGV